MVGVVSWGKGCASGEFPGVNARISSYVQFLEDSICSFSNHPPPFCNDGAKTVQLDSWFNNVTSPDNNWTASTQVLATTNNQTSTSEWDIPRPLLVTNNDPYGLSSSDSVKNSKNSSGSAFEWLNTTSESEFGTLAFENINDTATEKIGNTTSASRNQHFSSPFGKDPNVTQVNVTQGDDQLDQEFYFGNDPNATEVNTTQPDDQHPGNNTSSVPLTEDTIPANASDVNYTLVNNTLEDLTMLNATVDNDSTSTTDTDATTDSIPPNVSRAEEFSFPNVSSNAPSIFLLQGLLTLHIVQFSML